MSLPDNNLLQDLDPDDTARIDRRGTVLAQLEAALLADRLEVAEAKRDPAGSNPYDRATIRKDIWNTPRR